MLFQDFPKTRPVLPPSYELIHKEHYKRNREGRSIATALSLKLEGWMHRKVAEDVKERNYTCTTLEIGAGTLNHLPYEPNTTPYDIVEPLLSLYEPSEQIGRIRNIYKDIAQISRSEKYDRIISIATLEHICNLPEVVARAALLLKQGGQLRIAVPSEGTLLWRMACKLTTGMEFKLKYGLDYDIIMRHEHVNSAREIADILEFFFEQVKSTALGFSKKFSLYQFFICSAHNVDKCLCYLKDIVK
jgi:hypothetical protein